MEKLLILGERARREAITLVYAARDEERNNAVAIKKLIENLPGHSASTHATSGGQASQKLSSRAQKTKKVT